MSDDQLTAVRAFAEHTERAAKLLGCSYADAAMFLMKLGPLILLLHDPVFQDRFTRYMKGVASMYPASETPQGKGIH